MNLRRDGVTKRFSAPGDGVLIEICRDGILRRTFDLFWSAKVRKALGQVDGLVLDRQARHFADDGFSELGNPMASESRSRDGDVNGADHARMPIFFATLLKISNARSSISPVCVAVTIVRIRALPSGTVGKPIPVASNPRSNSAAEKA